MTNYRIEILLRNRAVSDKISDYHPDVIIYDIAIPYEENWKLFKKMKQ